MSLFKKCLAEYVGVFGIVMAGCGAVAVDQMSGGVVTHVGVAVTFGLIVMAMVYATGHLSGAHLNPAVTLAFAAVRHFPKRQVVPYIIAQIAGAASASWIHAVTLTEVLHQKFPEAILNLGVTHPVDNLWNTAFIWEALLTFFLMFVIMAVATDHRAVSKAAPIAIGAVVGLEAMFAGFICGASMNPARSFGPALVSGDWNHFSAYVVGPIFGAILGAIAYNFLRCLPVSKQSVQGCC